ncbi:hypothetical protein [Haloferax larsenii]|uniref:Uncharacterized protein n=1 Tax=Haloferax larsenii TaxID=302484 RepID=A0A1H7N6T5_HALLR|nr:hypothetical protein [Haloferax larsenii]SEL19213.1 hypothetical protein SAMN04488691_103209 [Haloferax larsenii]
MSIETTQTQSDSLTNQPQNAPSDETETIPNPERGCGYLKNGKAYLRSDVGPGGELPAFVEFAEPIPFKENRKRSYKEFPGLQFELSVTGPGGLTETVPRGEASRHIERLLNDRPTGTHAGEMVEFHSHDLLLSVGKSHYSTVQEFVDEARVHGVSKAISVTSGNSPPKINPGRTRLFLIHPRAVETTKTVETTAGEIDRDRDTLIKVKGKTVKDEALALETIDDDVEVTVRRTMLTPGVFGYTYLTRVVYTEDEDGEVPKYVQDYEATGELDIVKPGKPVPYSKQDEFTDDGELRAEYRNLLEPEADEPEPEPDANLDTDAVEEELDAKKDRIKEWAKMFDEDEQGAFSKKETDSEPETDEKEVLNADWDVNEMERASFGDFADRGWLQAESPLMAQDALSGAEEGALAVVHDDEGPKAVFPSNNLNVTETAGYTKGVSIVGPYHVEARLLNTGGRRVKIERTR